MPPPPLIVTRSSGTCAPSDPPVVTLVVVVSAMSARSMVSAKLARHDPGVVIGAAVSAANLPISYFTWRMTSAAGTSRGATPPPVVAHPVSMTPVNNGNSLCIT